MRRGGRGGGAERRPGRIPRERQDKGAQKPPSALLYAWGHEQAGAPGAPAKSCVRRRPVAAKASAPARGPPRAPGRMAASPGKEQGGRCHAGGPIQPPQHGPSREPRRSRRVPSTPTPPAYGDSWPARNQRPPRGGPPGQRQSGPADRPALPPYSYLVAPKATGHRHQRARLGRGEPGRIGQEPHQVVRGNGAEGGCPPWKGGRATRGAGGSQRARMAHQSALVDCAA